jgi:hypothetical protein
VNITLPPARPTARACPAQIKLYRNGTLRVTLPYSNIFYDDTGLTPDTEYTYQHSHINAVGETALSPSVTVRTTETNGTPTPTIRPRPTPTGGGAQPWQVFVDYSVGNLVTYGGASYDCIQAHTSQTGWEPPNVPALWSRR